MPARRLPTIAEIDAAERRLGPNVRLPQDYREWLTQTNGLEGWFGEVFLMMYPLKEIVVATEAADNQDRLPGFVAIGSDGSRCVIAYDLRRLPPPVVMTDIVTESWAEATLQADSFTAFMAQRARGEPFRWEGIYD